MPVQLNVTPAFIRQCKQYGYGDIDTSARYFWEQCLKRFEEFRLREPEKYTEYLDSGDPLTYTYSPPIRGRGYCLDVVVQYTPPDDDGDGEVLIGLEDEFIDYEIDENE